MSGEEIRERDPDAAPARPFEPAPRDLPAPRQGCSRMALAGCAAVLVLVGLGVLTLMIKAGDLVRWSLGQVRTEIVRTLPEDLPASERQRLAAAFEAVDERIESGELDAMAFQGLQQELMRFARLGRPPTEEEVAALVAALERFAGVDTGTSEPGANERGANERGAGEQGASEQPGGSEPVQHDSPPDDEVPSGQDPSEGGRVKD